jgi:N-methylhydantoinase B
VLGGLPGRTGRLIVDPETPDEQTLRGSGIYHLPAGSVVRFEGAGAGGLGDPLLRAPTLVVNDLRASYISIEVAEREYGLIVDRQTLAVDPRASESFRLQLMEQRGSPVR